MRSRWGPPTSNLLRASHDRLAFVRLRVLPHGPDRPFLRTDELFEFFIQPRERAGISCMKGRELRSGDLSQLLQKSFNFGGETIVVFTTFHHPSMYRRATRNAKNKFFDLIQTSQQGKRCLSTVQDHHFLPNWETKTPKV